MYTAPASMSLLAFLCHDCTKVSSSAAGLACPKSKGSGSKLKLEYCSNLHVRTSVRSFLKMELLLQVSCILGDCRTPEASAGRQHRKKTFSCSRGSCRIARQHICCGGQGASSTVFTNVQSPFHDFYGQHSCKGTVDAVHDAFEKAPRDCEVYRSTPVALWQIAREANMLRAAASLLQPDGYLTQT